MKRITDSRELAKELENLEDELDDMKMKIEEQEEEFQELIDELRELEDYEDDELYDADSADRRANEIEELKNKIDDLKSEIRDLKDEYLRGDTREEYIKLDTLINELKSYNSDFKHGVPIIREDYIKEYMEEYIDNNYPELEKMTNFIVVDWDKTLDNFLMDYTTFEYDNDTYFIQVD